MGVGPSQSTLGSGEGPENRYTLPWDFLEHLKPVQRPGKFTHSLSLLLLTHEEQDNIGSGWQGNSSFRSVVVLGLGGAGDSHAAGEPIPST